MPTNPLMKSGGEHDQCCKTKFPKNKLCYSTDADVAAVQDTAIQCAIISGLVPKHELCRNALMLDALPHTIVVLISSGEKDEMHIPILVSGMALPAMGYASFELTDIMQKGVTISKKERYLEWKQCQEKNKMTKFMY